MDRANWVLLGLAGVCFFVGVHSGEDESAPLVRKPVSLIVESSPVRRVASVVSTPASMPSSAIVSPQINSSYRARLSKWLSESRHVHGRKSRSVASEKIISKFKLRDIDIHSRIENKRNERLIFENRGSVLFGHFCEHSGVALQKLFDTGAAGTFYFQEGHMTSLSAVKSVPFCSITVRRKGNIKSELKHSYAVIEKKADFRLLPKFTGVRFWYDNRSAGEVIQEISCYTPVINPKQTEYDSLTDQDLAYAFHMNFSI